jgi:iron complex outermembrane receptor protein
MDGVKFDRTHYGLHFSRTGVTPLIAGIEARYYHNYVDHVMDNFSRRPFAPSPMMPGRSVSNPDRLTTGGLAQLVLLPAAPARLTVGLDAQRNTHALRATTNETTAPFAAKARVRDAEFRQHGAFAESEWTLAPTRRLTAGARLDRWRATDSRAMVNLPMLSPAANPDAGRRRTSDLAGGFARYEHDLAAPATTLFAGLGRTQRFPDYWELIKNESPASVSALGTRPETSTQFDVGAVHRRGALTFTVSAFVARLDDYNLVETGFTKPTPATGGSGIGARAATVTRNIAAATWGGEADLGWRFAEHWRCDASLAYVRGENDTDARPLAQLPPLETRLGLAYTQRAWSAGALWRLVAAQDRIALRQGNIVGQDLGRSAGFGVVAVNASWRVTTGLRLTAGIDNVLDRTFAEHISRAGSSVTGFTQTTRVNEPGRFLWLKLDVSR